MLLRKLLASLALALALVTAGVSAPAVAAPVHTAAPAACTVPSEYPVGIPTGTGSVWESGVWVFQSAVLHTGYKAGLCQIYEAGSVVDSPKTSTVKLRLAIEPAGGSSFSQFTPWVTVNEGTASALVIYSQMPDYVAFKLEAQSHLTNSSAAYCAASHCS